jgi:hypothetical protein
VTSLVVADYKDTVKQMYEVTNAILYEIYDEANSHPPGRVAPSMPTYCYDNTAGALTGV